MIPILRSDKLQIQVGIEGIGEKYGHTFQSSTLPKVSCVWFFVMQIAEICCEKPKICWALQFPKHHKLGGAKSISLLKASFHTRGDMGLFNVPMMNIFTM